MPRFFVEVGGISFFGMLGVTLFGTFLTPVFFYVIRRMSGQDTRTAGSKPMSNAQVGEASK